MPHLVQQLASLFSLSTYESRAYVSLHQGGPMHLKQLAKHASIPRTALYIPIQKLVKKGMVSETVFGKRRYYEAAPVDTLRGVFNERHNALEQVLSELSEHKALVYGPAKFDASLYYGPEGIKSAGLLFLNETKDKVWYSFENLSLLGERVGFEFEHFYIKERVRRGIRSKMILSHKDESREVKKILANDAKQLRETVLLSAHEYPFETTVVSTKGMTLVVNPNDNPFALLIRNNPTANSFIQQHRCIWDRYHR